MSELVNLNDITSETIAIGDKLLVSGTKFYNFLPELFDGSPAEEALSAAEKIQQQLFSVSISTIRTSVTGVKVNDATNGTYAFTIELEVVDIVNPTTGESTLGQAPEVVTNSVGSQSTIAGTINIGRSSISAWALAAVAVSVAVGLIELDNLTARVERIAFPDAAALEQPSTTSNIRDALIAASVLMIFYFLSKVAR